MKTARGLIGGMALALSISFATPARAGEDYGGPELVVAFLDVPVALLSIAPDVVNAVHIARGTRSPVGWRVVGYVFGAAAIAAGALTLDAYAGASRTGTGVAIGGATVALGVVDVALGVWNETLPPARLSPVVATDVRGAPVVGLSFALTRF